MSFGQAICGFDLLRSGGRSFVCDVNGWSFVKESHKFWEDSANLLRHITLSRLAPTHLERFPQGTSPVYHALQLPEEAKNEGKELVPALGNEEGEMLCVVAIIRHGDRTPKQKLKFNTGQESLLRLVQEHAEEPNGEARFKKVRQMEQLTDVVDWSSGSRGSANFAEKIRQTLRAERMSFIICAQSSRYSSRTRFTGSIARPSSSRSRGRVMPRANN